MSEEKKKVKFRYFRYVDTDKKEPVIRNTKKGVQKYEKRVQDRVYIEAEEIFRFNLEDVTPAVSVDDGGGFTQYHNYLWLWTQFIGGMPVLTYMAIRKYLFDYMDRKESPEEFIAFPPLEEICKRVGVKDTQTLNKYIDKLEEYGFLYRFWKAVDMHDKDGKLKGTKDSGVVFVVRKKIPLLSDDLVEKLSKSDREYHEKVKNSIGRSGFIVTGEAEYLEEYKKHIKELIDKGSFRLSNGKKKKTYSYLENGELITKSADDIQKEIKQYGISTEDKEFWDTVLGKLSHEISKPSYDTWFKNTLAYRSRTDLIILAPNEFSCEWIGNQYIPFLNRIIENEFGLLYNIKVELLNEAED